MRRTGRLIGILAVLGIPFFGIQAASAATTEIYFNDFESGSISGWSLSSNGAEGFSGITLPWTGYGLGTDSTPGSPTKLATKFLGRNESFTTGNESTNPINNLTASPFNAGTSYDNLGLGNDKVTLGLTGLAAHDSVTVSFDLFIIHSWNGSDETLGPDTFGFGWNTTTLFSETFANHTGDLQSFGPNSSDPARTGAAGYTGDLGSDAGPSDSNGLGYWHYLEVGDYRYGDSWYTLTFTFNHSASDLSLFFLASGLAHFDDFPTIEDESWGLDNVRVSINTSAVPLPPAVLLLLSAAASLLGFARRRH